MQKKYIEKIKKGIIMFILLILALMLASQSVLRFSKVIVIFMAMYVVLCWKFRWLGKLIIFLVSGLMVVYIGRYFFQTVFPLREKYDATRYQQLTQLSISANWENSEMWISPITNKKIVDLTYAEEWCHAYFEEFARTVQISKKKMESKKMISQEMLHSNFFGLNEHRFSGTKDFFEKDIIIEMYSGETAGHLYIAAEGLADASTVYVMTDNEHNVYLMSEKILEKVLNENEE